MSKTGYAFVLAHGDWRAEPDEAWDTEVITGSDKAELLGGRVIDGSIVRVYRQPDGAIVAQLPNS